MNNCTISNLPKCSACIVGSKCWVDLYRLALLSLSNEAEFRIFLKTYVSNNSQSKYFPYLKASIQIYCPQFLETFNKFAMLL